MVRSWKWRWMAHLLTQAILKTWVSGKDGMNEHMCTFGASGLSVALDSAV